MSIDYTEVIRSVVEPRLAYHGFKYSDEHSYPAQGDYSFRRSYWGKSQYLNIVRAEYDDEAVAGLLAAGYDSPTEVPADQLLIKEPGYRLWLSNRYLNVVVGHEGGSSSLTRTGIGNPRVFRQLKRLPFDEAHPQIKELEREHIYWEFRGEAELRKVLGEIVEVFLRDGLEWFEEQVAEVRRHHRKLDERRLAERRRRHGEGGAT